MPALDDLHDNAMLEDSTIAAVATPAGRGGIGVLRLSGPDAAAVAAKLFPREAPPAPRVAHYCILREAGGARVDDALLTYFPAPHSYTGEDVVEIATHGSPVVLDWLLRAALAHGATQARPGEFTERAFLHGRIDLVQAEAVRDLIDAQTLEQARQAAEQMGGSVAAVVRPIKEQLVILIAALEAGIDFAEDDIDTMPSGQIAASIGLVLPPLQTLLASFAHGRLLREGLRLAIVGKPNAGKSSLFNRLVERERAIVTATPGTTRDVIAERISLYGIPVELLDTAGLRDTEDEAERLGVARSREAMAEADAVLLVVDAVEQSPDDGIAHEESSGELESETSPYELLRNRPVIVVWNKIDLLHLTESNTNLDADTHLDRGTIQDELPQLPGDAPSSGKGVRSAFETIQPCHKAPGQIRLGATYVPRGTYAQAGTNHWREIRVSAVTGEGIPALRAAILALATGGAAASAGAMLTNLRHRDDVARAHASLLRAQYATQTATPHEMLLLDLYEALHALDELTGQTTADDILHRIFSTFCIGK